MSEKPLRGYYPEEPDDPTKLTILIARHLTIQQNTDEVIDIMRLDSQVHREGRELAQRTHLLLKEGKAILWTVNDPRVYEGSATVSLIYPNREADQAILAIVVNADIISWQQAPGDWSSSMMKALYRAIYNLPRAYDTISKSSVRLLDEDSFYEIIDKEGFDKLAVVPATLRGI